MVRTKLWKLATVFLALFAGGCVASAQVYLTADGVTPAYTRIKGVLHASPENPDCAHPIFGPHITQAPDTELGSYAFDFNIHVIPEARSSGLLNSLPSVQPLTIQAGVASVALDNSAVRLRRGPAAEPRQIRHA